MEVAICRERSPAPARLEKALVQEAKQYLQQRLRKLAPDAVLTQAWDRFYQTYTEVLRRMARGFRLDAHEREDLVQEVWARVIVHLHDFQWDAHGAGLRGWLYTLIRNQAVSLIRRKVRRPVRLSSGAAIQGVADRDPGPAAQWQAYWDRELMHLLLATLAKKVTPVNHRLLILRWIEGRSLAEVALTLNLTQKQVSYRQQRLFRKLRAEGKGPAKQFSFRGARDPLATLPNQHCQPTLPNSCATLWKLLKKPWGTAGRIQHAEGRPIRAAERGRAAIVWATGASGPFSASLAGADRL